jgi:hypothetical protein
MVSAKCLAILRRPMTAPTALPISPAPRSGAFSRVTGTINLPLIRENWPDAIRLAGSLKLGHVKAAGIMRTLQVKDKEWLARHPRWTFHFTPTSASWLNAVEGFFAKLTKRRPQDLALGHNGFLAVLRVMIATSGLRRRQPRSL